MRPPRTKQIALLCTTSAVVFLSGSACGLRAAPKSAPAKDPATVPMGVNLEGLADWMRTPMFVDAMRTSRKFGAPGTPWDSSSPVDADGCPTGDAGSVIITGLPHMGGVYHLSCVGRTQIVPVASHATVTKTRFDPATGRTSADIAVADDSTQLMLSFRHTQGGVKRVRLIRPGYPADTRQVFTNEFLAALKPFSTLRLMDYLDTNDTKVVRWSDRAKPTDAQYTLGKGGALEDAIALANTAGKDLWINIPDQADDDYVTREARLFKDTLAPGRHVYLEYSNEVWNFAFGQTQRNQQAAEAEAQNPASPLRTLTGVQWDDAGNKYYWGYKRVPEQLLRISRLWRGVYGAQAYARTVRPVLASQIANPFILKLQVGFLAKTVGPPADSIYGVAGAPYYALSDDTAKRPDLTVNQALAELDRAIDAQGDGERAYARIAAQSGVKLLAYEGGTDIRQYEQSLDAKLAANRDPRMKDLTVRYLQAWYENGGDLFMYFNLCGGYSKWGAWGLTDDIVDLHTPKFEGVRQVLAAPRPPVLARTK